MTASTSSARAAAKSDASVRGDMSQPSRRSSLIRSLIVVPPGSRATMTVRPCSSRKALRSSSCVVLPAPSMPSKVMNITGCSRLSGIDTTRLRTVTTRSDVDATRPGRADNHRAARGLHLSRRSRRRGSCAGRLRLREYGAGDSNSSPADSHDVPTDFLSARVLRTPSASHRAT